MSKTIPKNLKGLSERELEEFAVSMGEKPFRGRQLFEWMYHKQASGFAEMTDLPASFRERLESGAAIGALTLRDERRSPTDGTTKLLFGLADGRNIESVLIPPKTAYRDGDDGPAEVGTVDDGADGDGTEARDLKQERERLTLCVSTQVGCPLDCVFCATATMGFRRNLTAGEIVDQVMAAGRVAGRKITNIVYMGMGEPLLNYDEVMKSADIISTGLKIAAKRITVSTAGWTPGITRMADERRRVKLAISLHSLDEGARTELMPVTKKHPLPGLLDAEIRRLVALLKRIPGKVNIIPYHSIAFSLPAPTPLTLRPAPAGRIDAFARKLRDRHVTVFVRSSAGEDINAACGQLAVRHAGRATTAAAGKRTPVTSH